MQTLAKALKDLIVESNKMTPNQLGKLIDKYSKRIFRETSYYTEQFRLGSYFGYDKVDKPRRVLQRIAEIIRNQDLDKDERFTFKMTEKRGELSFKLKAQDPKY